MKRVIFLVLSLVCLLSYVKADPLIWTDSITNTVIPFPDNSVVVESNLYAWNKVAVSVPQYGLILVYSSTKHGKEKMKWEEVNRLAKFDAVLVKDEKVTDLKIEARRRTYQYENVFFRTYIIKGEQYVVCVQDFPSISHHAEDTFLVDSLIYRATFARPHPFRSNAEQLANTCTSHGTWIVVVLGILWFLLQFTFFRLSHKSFPFRLTIVGLWALVATFFVWVLTISVAGTILLGISFLIAGLLFSTMESFKEVWNYFLDMLKNIDV